MNHLLRAEVMLPPMPRVLRPATLVATAMIRRGGPSHHAGLVREMSGLYNRPVVEKALDRRDAAAEGVYRVLAMNTGCSYYR